MAEKEKNTPPALKKDKQDKKDKNDKGNQNSKSAQTSGFKRWIREMKAELSKVQWPSQKETTKHTITVLCCVGLIGAFIWIYDFLAANVIEALIALT